LKGSDVECGSVLVSMRIWIWDVKATGEAFSPQKRT
jgi:hypothetical protein